MLACTANILPSLRPVGHEDAKGEPDGGCRVATDDIAEVMCAEVDPAEPDEQDQDRKYGNGGPPWKIGPRYPGKQVSQKSIGDERSHGVLFPVEVVDRPACCVCSSLEPLNLCLDRDGGRNGQRDAALVLRQVLPLLWCNWQDQVFRPVTCD